MEKDDYYEKFFKKYMNRTAEELFEWQGFLFFLRQSDRIHYKTRLAEEGPDSSENCNNIDGYVGTLYLCAECSKRLIDSKKLVVDVIHDPHDQSFPPKFDDKEFERHICKEAFADLIEFSTEMISELKNDPEYISFFPDNDIMDHAAVYFYLKWDLRKDVPLEKFEKFLWLSWEVGLLSIIYYYFDEFLNAYQSTVDPEYNAEDFFNELEELKRAVIGNSHEMIGYWKLQDEKKKFQAISGRKGGTKQTRLPGIIEAAIKHKTEAKLKTSLDTFIAFLKKYPMNNPLQINGFEMYVKGDVVYHRDMKKTKWDRPLKLAALNRYFYIYANSCAIRPLLH